jgi:hypothetical protein
MKYKFPLSISETNKALSYLSFISVLMFGVLSTGIAFMAAELPGPITQVGIDG